MQNNQRLVIGLFGFGVVGEGLYKVLDKTPSLHASIKKVCIKDPHKTRNAPSDLFTTDKEELLNDEEINVIVEVINEAQPAFEIVKRAISGGKAVVSASKKMIAENLREILQLQKQYQQPFLYEAAACASIPVIRNLEEYYDNDLLHSIRAIVNGSTNFILTKMFEDKLEFKQALILAQQLGFAEVDPKLDVDGWDALNKWTFLLTHAYGILVNPEEIVFTGIQHVQLNDAAVAKSRGYEIKLVAQAKKLSNGAVAAFVLPQFVAIDDPLAFVKNEFNGVVIESGFADKQFFYGKGAGSFPTASAVLSDISALRYSYRYEYKKLYDHTPHVISNDYFIRVYVSFNEWKYIPREKFQWIEEWHAGERKYLVGVLSFSEILETSWWKENDVSMIVMPDAIIEDVEVRKLKIKSLELAGIID